MSLFFIFIAYFIPATISLVLWSKILIEQKTSFLSVKWLKIFIWSFLPIINLFCVCYAMENCSMINKNRYSEFESYEESSYE
jgi:hypothetical protein